MDISVPPMADLSNAVAYGAAGASIVVGLMMVGWGRFWSRLVLGLAGVGAGLACGGILAGLIRVDPWIARAAVASVLGVLGFVGAPFLWAILAGALCSSVGGILLAARVLPTLTRDRSPRIAPVDGATMTQWAEDLARYFQEASARIWPGQWGLMLLVMTPLMLIPVMIGFWKQRFITIVMTSLAGAMLAVGGAVIALTQGNKTGWPNEWSGASIPLIVAGAMCLLGVTIQYVFALSKARKHKAKEASAPRSGGGR